ncbi:MAG TPA: hypothetical protein VL576_02700 [Candidatus Paceibacterota bacterium]|jgi:hypothetical protein|nr:hypothetical protein [Candidatus Paceibacterota bacterium]
MYQHHEWLPVVLKSLGEALVGIALIWFVIRQNKKRRKKLIWGNRRPYQERELPEVKAGDLPEGETIIIVDFIKTKQPIVQFVFEFQKEMNDTEGACFVLREAELFHVQYGKTYQVEKNGKAGIVNLVQVAMFIDREMIFS